MKEARSKLPPHMTSPDNEVKVVVKVNYGFSLKLTFYRTHLGWAAIDVERYKTEHNTTMIPENIKGSLDRYINDGIKPGDFTYGVLINDLAMAVGHADVNSRKHLKEIVAYVHSNLPPDSHGSKETVQEWMKSVREGNNG